MGNEQAKTGGREELHNALLTVAKAILGDELESIRDSIKMVETRLQEQLEDGQRKTAGAVDSLKRELTVRVDQLRKDVNQLRKDLESEGMTREKAQSEILARLGKPLDELKQQVRKNDDTIRKELETTRLSLRKDLSALEQSSRGEFASISETFKQHQSGLRDLGAQLELQESQLDAQQSLLDAHSEQYKRTAGVLSNVGRMFAGTQEAATAQSRRAPTAAPAPPSPSAARPKQAPVAPPPAQPKKAAAAPVKKATEPEKEDKMDSELPDGGDIIAGIDGMFKLGKGQ